MNLVLVIFYVGEKAIYATKMYGIPYFPNGCKVYLEKSVLLDVVMPLRAYRVLDSYATFSRWKNGEIIKYEVILEPIQEDAV